MYRRYAIVQSIYQVFPNRSLFIFLYIFILQLWRLMNLYFDKKCHNCTKSLLSMTSSSSSCSLQQNRKLIMATGWNSSKKSRLKLSPTVVSRGNSGSSDFLFRKSGSIVIVINIFDYIFCRDMWNGTEILLFFMNYFNAFQNIQLYLTRQISFVTQCGPHFSGKVAVVQ